MNVRKDSGSDEEIKQALRDGVIIATICKELRTHTQRVMKIKKAMSQTNYTYQTKLQDSFILNSY